MAEPPQTGPDDRRPPSYDAGKEAYAGISAGALDSIEGLHDARAFAEMIVDTVREGLLVLDLDLRVVAANESFYQAFGVQPEATVGRRVYDLGNGQWDLPELRTLLEEILPADATFDGYEVDHEFERIGRRVMVLNARRLDDHQMILLAVEDATERKRAEEEALEAKEYAERIVEMLHEPLLVLSPDLRVKSANQAFYDHFEVGRAETEGRLVYDLGNGQWDIPELRRLLEDVLPDDRAFTDYEVRHDFESIGERVMLVSARRLDHVRLILLGLRDVTERARAEEALRQSEARYRAIFDTIGISIWEEDFSDVKRALDALAAEGVTDVRHYLEAHPEFVERTLDLVRVLDVNDATLTLYGVPDKEALLGPLRPVFLPEAMPTFIEELLVLAEGGSFLASEVPLQTLRGERVDVAFTFSAADPPVYSRVLVSLLDITERKKAEDAVRDLNRTLEDRVEARTREVREMAARLTTAEQAERERIARVLHDDLQQQLVGLSMTLDLLRRPSDDDEAARLADQADAVLGGAIDTARTLAAELSPAALGSPRVADLLQWLALRKRALWGMGVEVEVEEPCAVADRALRVLLYQALREVLLNVVKHAGTTRARLRAWTDDGLATVRVEDDGVGFDPAAVAAGAGGFGLPHVRERVERAGGWLGIDSAPGEGARITIAIPAEAQDAAA